MTNIVYMHRCLQLAQYGESYVSPNPMVGAVIVCDDTIVGEGYHMCCGELHAEPNAINSVIDKSVLKKSTLYVNLEPCSHYGKTPPCTDLIIKHGIPKVVIGMQDPNPKVSGNGIEKLRQAGIDVQVGVLEDECRELNKRFITFFEKKRPYVILKWAQTADGFIDKERKDTSELPLLISNPLTKILAHKLRVENQSILIGTRTALLDNPSLTARDFTGKNPIRLLIDKEGKIPLSNKVFNDGNKTIVFTKGEIKNVESIVINFGDNLVESILEHTYKKGINSILVEGGAILLQQFINKNLWDEAFVETATFNIEKGVKAPIINKLPIDRDTYCKHTIYSYKNNSNYKI